MHVTVAAATADYEPNVPASSEYADLKRQIQALGLLQRQHGYYAAKFVITGGLLAGTLFFLAVSPNDPWLRLAEAALLAFAVVQIGLLAHDASHQQIVGAGRVNVVMG